MELWLLIVLIAAATIIFLVTGVILVIAGKRLKSKIGDSIIRIPATITKISYRLRKGRRIFTPHVQYTFNGIEYNSKLHYYSSSMKVGNIIDILIDKESPEAPKGNPKIFSIIGISFVIAWIFITALFLILYIML